MGGGGGGVGFRVGGSGLGVVLGLGVVGLYGVSWGCLGSGLGFGVVLRFRVWGCLGCRV